MYSDFGADLPERLRAIGFVTRVHERHRDGVSGGYTVVLESTRAA